MLVSLKTRNLSDARLRLGQHLREFERTLSKATGRPDPTASTEPRHVQPTLAEIDAAVRAWVKERLHNYTPPNGDVRTRLQGLEQEAVSLGTRYEFGEAMPDLQTEWIAEAIRDEAGWPVSEGTPLFDHLIRMVARGQVEAARQQADRIRNRPRIVRDLDFGPEEYRLDAARETEKQAGQPVPLMVLFDGYAAEQQPAPATVKAWRRMGGSGC